MSTGNARYGWRKDVSNVVLRWCFRLRIEVGTWDVLVFLVFFKDRLVELILIILILDFLISVIEYDMELRGKSEISIKFVREQLYARTCVIRDFTSLWVCPIFDKIMAKSFWGARRRLGLKTMANASAVM